MVYYGSRKETIHHFLANIVFGTAIVLSTILLGVLAATYIYFTGPFPTFQASTTSLIILVTNSLSICFTIIACIYVFLAKYRKIFFILVVISLCCIIILSAYSTVAYFLLKTTVADVEAYISSGFVVGRTPNFINYMQQKMDCCGGYDFQTYLNKTQNEDQKFWVPKSCCWSQKNCDNGNLLVKQLGLLVNVDETGGNKKVRRDVDYLEALDLWYFSYDLMKGAQKPGGGGIEGGAEDEADASNEMKRRRRKSKSPANFQGMSHHSIVKSLVSTSGEHEYTDKYSRKQYWMSDQDAIPIKLFGCGWYLQDFEEYNVFHEQSQTFLRRTRLAIKILLVLVLVAELFKLALVIYFGIHFKHQRERGDPGPEWRRGSHPRHQHEDHDERRGHRRRGGGGQLEENFDGGIASPSPARGKAYGGSRIGPGGRPTSRKPYTQIRRQSHTPERLQNQEGKTPPAGRPRAGSTDPLESRRKKIGSDDKMPNPWAH